MITLLLLSFLLKRKISIKVTQSCKYLFLVLIAMLVSSSATPQVTADFTTITSVTGCGSLVVEFKDLSTISPTSWLWDFGNGDTSTLKNPIAVYNTPGFYDVVLKVSDGFLTNIKTVSSYIKVYEEPIAFLKATYNCIDPLSVEFTNLSVGANNFLWDFGDGTISNQTNPNHVYSALGVYNVILTVGNNITSCTHEFLKQVKLTQPIANFDYLINPNNGYEDSVGCVPKRAYLKQNSQDWSFYKVLWSDGYIGYGRVDHLFLDTGTFDVTMIITDIHGCKDTATIENMYHMRDVNADFGVTNVLGCDSFFVEFEDLSNPPSSVNWDFGDGTTSILNNPQHIYYNEGVYDVTLYAESFYGCRDTIKRLEYVKFKHPVADLSSNIQDICEGDQVQFTNHSDGLSITSSWDFGDGTTSNILHPNHAFLTNGFYNINLLVTDSFGCTDILNLNNYIEVLSPTADFSSLGLSSNCPPLISSFTNLSSSDASLFEWNFGDGGTSLIEHPSHLYSNSGLFDVSLIVENTFGCKDTLVQNSFVDMSGVFPTGNFIVSDTLICKDESVVFTPTVVNTDNFLWDFGNGVVSTDSLATAIYSNVGMFIPTLIIENSSGCQLIVNSDDTIKVKEVNVDAGVDVAICEGESVQLNAIGNSLLFTWSPANALSSINTSNPQANPTTSGFYYINHTDGLCTAIDSLFVTVHNDVPNATFVSSNHCELDVTSFVANSGLSSSNNTYTWSFGQNGQLVNSVLNVGNNNISLIIENLNNSCKDTLVQNVEIFQNPVADFLVADICLGASVAFADNSSSNTTVWAYDFGDGIGVSADQNPTYTYTNPGVYTVTLSLTSDMGCEDSIMKDVIVHALPIADFSIENHCEGDGNVFTDLSSVVNSDIALIEYNFNDGFISSDSMVTHIFNGYGLFDVVLTATSTDGCSSSKVKTTEVFANPIVDFVASQFCFGEQTIFNDFSFVPDANITSYNWNFGLEGSSTTKNTSHVFSSHGVFDIDLSIMSDRGCEGMLSKKITIHKLPSADFKIASDICLGDEVEISYLSDANVAAWNYNFGDGSFSTEQHPIHTYTSISSFDVSLEVISAKGCKNDTTMSAIIQVHALPIADFQASTLFASELSPEINFYNHSKDATFFMWNFDNGEYSSEENPIVSFYNPQIYNVVLRATNEIGCSSEMIKTVQINPEYTFFIPDAFTPDGDGLNDVFEAQGNRISSFEMQVFDRWGGIVFSSASIELGWDGNNSSGEQLRDGIYLYHIALYDLNERLWVYNGELKLMR